VEPSVTSVTSVTLRPLPNLSESDQRDALDSMHGTVEQERWLLLAFFLTLQCRWSAVWRSTGAV
jgi:hypothetical protein